MLPHYNLYSNGERITAKPISFSTLLEMQKHDKVTIMNNGKPSTYSTNNVRAVKVYIV